MKLFDYTISNPPYQVQNGVHDSGRVNYIRIYDRFQMVSALISDVTMMIYPAAWQFSPRKGFGEWLLSHGLTDSTYYPGHEVFGDAITKHYPISVTRVQRGHSGTVKVNGEVDLDRDSSVWVDSPEIMGLLSATEKWDRLSGGITHVTSLSHIRGQEDKFSDTWFDGAVKMYVKAAPGTQSDAVDRFISVSDVKEFLRVPLSDLELYQVAIPASVFKQARLFRVIAGAGGEVTFGAKVFPPYHIFGRTYVRVKTFSSCVEAQNFADYFNSRIPTLLATLDNTVTGFASYVPDLGDYSAGNPDIEWDAPLDPQLEKLFIVDNI